MPTFYYDALNEAKEPISGEVQADSINDALLAISADGLMVQAIRSSDGLLATPTPRLNVKLQRAIEKKSDFAPKLDAFINALPTGKPRKELKLFAESLQQDISVDRITKTCPAWAPLLVASDESDEMLAESMDVISGGTQTKTMRRHAFLYPIAIWVSAFIVLIALCIYVVPIFSEMFHEFGLRLPYITKEVVFLSDWIVQSGWSFAAAIGGIALSLIALVGIWKSLKLSQVIFGYIPAHKRASELSNLTGQVAVLLDSGLPLDESLRAASMTCREGYYRDATQSLIRHRVTGTTPPSSILPANVLRAIGMLDDGQPNVTLLRELSQIYREREFGNSDWWSGLVAALSIVLLGVMVGVIVLSLFAPLVSLVSGLT